ncbi:MAG: glycosyltransferase family 4 protein [Planctomycetota bacterium]
MPSSRANAVHVMKMSHAFSREVEPFCMYAYSSSPRDHESLFQRYGTKPFAMRLSRRFKIPGYLHYYSRMVARQLRITKTDLAYSRFLLGSRLAQKSKIPSVTELHSDLWNKNKNHKHWFDSLVASNLTLGFVTISDTLKQDLLEAYPQVDSSRVLVAHDAADLPVTSTEPVANRLEKWVGKPQVGYTGSLHQGKGADMLVKLANRSEFRDVQFHVVGGNQEQIESYRRQTTQGNVVFHGHVDHANIINFIRAFDVCLLPNEPVIKTGAKAQNISRYTSPLKLFEYMSCSKAIICSDLEVLREILNEDNAVLVDALDEDAWAIGLQKLLDGPQLRTDLGTTAHRDFCEKHTWQRRAKTIAEWCESRLAAAA